MSELTQQNQNQKQFLVLYDDENGITCPMMRDTDCDGALCAWCSPNKIAMFRTRAAARKAIVISTKYAELMKSQGKPENTEFTKFRKFIRIVELEQEGGAE